MWDFNSDNLTPETKCVTPGLERFRSYTTVIKTRQVFVGVLFLFLFSELKKKKTLKADNPRLFGIPSILWVQPITLLCYSMSLILIFYGCC